jgi:ABC-type sugar transport system permease subunit
MTGESTSISFIKSKNRHGWLFVSLALVLLGVFLFYPIVYSLYLSTTSSKGIVQKFVGFSNIFPCSSSNNVIFSPYTCNDSERQNNKI